MIKNAIYNILINDTTLTGIVGNNIFPVIAPQETDWPFIVIINNSTTPVDVKNEVSTNDLFSFQVDMYSKNDEECQTIAARIRLLIDQYTGTSADINVRNIVFRDEQDGEFDFEVEVFAKSQEYSARIIR